jgi:hypothetical protein
MAEGENPCGQGGLREMACGQGGGGGTQIEKRCLMILDRGKAAGYDIHAAN